MKLFLLLTFGLGSVAGGEPPRVVPGALVPLSVGGEELVTLTPSLSLLIQALERGHPLVSRLAKPGPLKVTPAETSFAGFLQGQQSLLESLKTASQENRKATLKETESVHAWKDRALSGLVVDPVPPGGETLPAPSAQVAPFTQESLPLFLSCATRALPLLKALRIAGFRGDEASALAIDSALFPERGDGESISSEGIVCGKYLGELGFFIVDRLDEIKWLTALSRAIQTKNREAWNYFWLYGSSLRGQELQVPHFWFYAWKRAAFSLVFQQGRIPEREVLTTQYLRAFQMQPGHRGFTVTNPKTLRSAIDVDWQSAENRGLLKD